MSPRAQLVGKYQKLNPGHVREIKDCSGKSRTDGQLRYSPLHPLQFNFLENISPRLEASSPL